MCRRIFELVGGAMRGCILFDIVNRRAIRTMGSSCDASKYCPLTTLPFIMESAYRLIGWATAVVWCRLRFVGWLVCSCGNIRWS